MLPCLLNTFPKMTKEELIDLDFRNLGFRWVGKRTAVLPNGCRVIVNAHGYRESRERPDDTPLQRAALRLYSIQREGVQETDVLNELELQKLLGESEFCRLCTHRLQQFSAISPEERANIVNMRQSITLLVSKSIVKWETIKNFSSSTVMRAHIEVPLRL